MALSRHRNQILRLLEDHLFGDDEISESIDWHLYKGQATAVQTITIPDAARVKHEIGAEELEDGVSAQRARRNYIIKESRLPAGITYQDLTKNDRVTIGDTEFMVEGLDKTLEFVIYASLVGPK